VIAGVDQGAERLAALHDAGLPAEADRDCVNEWLHRSHLSDLAD
jgi:hypothetical protein